MAKVLITDDSSFMRDMIGDVVKKAGIEVEYASSGEELLERYSEIQPDVVILDIVLMGLNGINTLTKLKEIDPEARVLVCSSLAGEEPFWEDAMNSGAYACIKKPFDAKELLQMVEIGVRTQRQPR